ncbi:MAG: XylR family transcriptional regulator [Sedimentisphaerales bacterium]|jgi:LacI family transcriptional regulator|nr:XylR family transcriptional regulator [Sedimentisphaerales bacterium]
MKRIRKIVMLLNPSRNYTRGLIRGIAKYAHLQSDWVFYRPLHYREPTPERSLVEILQELRPHGIFMREPERTEEIIALGIPTVSYPYTVELIPGVANVAADHMAIGQMAARHFLERGFQHFAYNGFDDWWWSRKRREGFCGVVREAGYETHVYELPPKDRRTWDKELPAIGRWLKSLPLPVGLMACNDDRAELIIEACRAVGLSVPDQVAVVGVDNDPLICELCSPPLSSVSLGLEKAGYESAALLDQMIRDRTVRPRTIYIEPTHVETRLSSDTVAVTDEYVAAAVRFIRDNSRRSITAKEVADGVLLCRRALEKRFRRILGKSIHDEIRRVRIEIITRMLMDRHLRISDIAEALGFPSTSHLSRYFRSQMGISPLEYRAKHLA